MLQQYTCKLDFLPQVVLSLLSPLNIQTTSTQSNTQTTPVPSTTTTTIHSIPSTQIQLSYTPDYDVVFIGVDDVIVTCVATNENSLQLHVSLFDVNNGNLLKEETDNDDRVEIEERIELVEGNLTYKCIAVTEIGSEEAFISIRAESELEYNFCLCYIICYFLVFVNHNFNNSLE